MRTSLIRRCSAMIAASALCLSLGVTSADATPPAAPAPATAEDGAQGLYLSPWGDADVQLAPEIVQWMEREQITLSAVHPFSMHADGRGFSMPIGSTAGDHLDSKGRIFYPGGLHFHHKPSGKTITFKPTWIRVMPRPGYAAGVSVDGKPFADEMQIGDTRAAEVMASARPSPTGWRLEKVPFYVTEEVSRLFSEQFQIEAPAGGSRLGTLTPDFRYIPTKSSDQLKFPG